MNISNSHHDIGTSKFTHRNVQNGSLFNKLITLQRVIIDTESSVGINNEIIDQNHITEEISFHQNLAEIIDHACDDSGINLANT